MSIQWLSELKVGDCVYLVSFYSNVKPVNGKVSKVGRKYITVAVGDDRQFRFDKNTGKDDYRYSVYKSKEHYIECLEQAKIAETKNQERRMLARKLEMKLIFASMEQLKQIDVILNDQRTN